MQTGHQGHLITPPVTSETALQDDLCWGQTGSNGRF